LSKHQLIIKISSRKTYYNLFQKKISIYEDDE